MNIKIVFVIVVFSVVIFAFFCYQNVPTNKAEKIRFDQSFPEDFKKIIRKDQLSKIQVAVTNKSSLGKTITLFTCNNSYAASITRISVSPNFSLKMINFEVVKEL